MKNNKIIKGFVKLKKLPASCFIDPKLVSIYRSKQNKIIKSLKNNGYQEIHTPLFVPKKLFSQPKNISNKWFTSAFSGKDKRTNFYLRPFFGFQGAIPFASTNIRSYRQLPLYLIEKGPLYGNFPAKWNLIKNSKEDYLGLQGVLVSDKRNINQLINQINKLFSFLEIDGVRKKQEDFLGIETVSFYWKGIFICACFNLKDTIGKTSKIFYLDRNQQSQPIFWQSFYLSQNLIFLLHEAR